MSNLLAFLILAMAGVGFFNVVYHGGGMVGRWLGLL